MTTKTSHKNFAVNALGVDVSIYDEMNARNEARNAEIRAARTAYFDAIGTDDQAAAAAKLDALLHA